MKTRYAFLVLFLFLFGTPTVFGQLGFSHEVGLLSGPVAFQSDYGLRNNFETNKGNMGFGIALVHYINFAYRADCNCYARDTYFSDHFKIRTELDFHLTKLNHFGEDAESDSDEGRDLRDMEGRAKAFEIGSSLEFFPLSIRDYIAGAYRWAPYVSVGAHYVTFDPQTTSRQPGIIGLSPENTFDPFIGGVNDEQDNTWSIVWGIGTRFKIAPLADLVIESRWHYYLSNWVDGLNPNDETYLADKYNDWIYWVQVGYIYYLD